MSGEDSAHFPAVINFGNIHDGCVRVQPIMHIARTISELGADPGQVFTDTGILAELFDSPENAISFQALGTLIENCVAATGCPHFGLLLGAGAAGNPLGMLGEVMQECADVGTAIAYAQQNLHLHDRGAMATRFVDGKVASLGYILFDAQGTAVDQIYDGAMAIAMGLMRTLCGPKWKPAAVLLPHRRPHDAAPFRKVFGCMPHFNAEQAALLFPVGDLERRIAGADPGRYALLAERLRTIARQQDLKFTEQVRRVVRGLAAVRKCSLDAVAAQFSMNRRRMNRMLEREGMTYHQITQKVLRSFAERLMLDTDMTLGRISAVLDYSDASAFTRAFRNWHGCSPREWRHRHASSADVAQRPLGRS
ncbi:MAG: AraC family transcriptional regulator [Azonexus sp.]